MKIDFEVTYNGQRIRTATHASEIASDLKRRNETIAKEEIENLRCPQHGTAARIVTIEHGEFEATLCCERFREALLSHLANPRI